MSGADAYPWEVPHPGKAADFAASLRARLPRLETERLILRAPMLEDFAAYAEILMSERAAHMDGPFTREAAWLDFNSTVGSWLLRGHGCFTVTLKASGEVLGFVLLQMEYSDHEPELGYFFRAAAEGKGFALEAARAVRAHALDTLEMPALVSYVAPANARSRRLAEALGARPDSAAAARLPEGEDAIVYRHAPAEARP